MNVTQKFWENQKNNPNFANFYDLFDGHHPGIDTGLPIGTPLQSCFDGIVVRVEYHSGMGNVVSVRNGNILALYAHLSEISVSLGQIVKAGQNNGI